MSVLNSVEMKRLCIVLIGSLLSLINQNSVGHVVPQDSKLLLKTNGNIAELYNSGGSWLQAVLLFARHDQTGVNGNSTYASFITHESKSTLRCPNEFVTLGEHCYYFSPNTANWHDARKTCLSLGSVLAHPMSSPENTLLANYLRNHYNGSSAWSIGGTDEDKEGEWVWAHSKARIVFSDWSLGQPDNAGKNENCMDYVEIFDWKWNDRPCDYISGYICQQ